MGSIFAEKARYGSDAVTTNPAKSVRALGSAFRGMRPASCDFIFGTVRLSAVQDRSRNKRPPHTTQARGLVMKILMVLTSHDQLGNTGRKTGFWLEELAAPYFVFRDAGVDITLASPKGGQPPLDPKSNEPDFQTDDTRRFEQDPAAKQALANTVKLSEIEQADYDSVFFPGGHGPLWDLTNDRNALSLIEDTL